MWCVSLLVVLFSGVLAATIGAASAETILVNSTVLGHVTRPSGGCPPPAHLCGGAAIDGFGRAEYFVFFSSFVPDADDAACGDYAATATFELGDGSTLVLDESGVSCGPDGSFLKGPLFTAYGNPRSWSGTWEVQSATGQFDGLTGSGAVSGLTAGAAVKATYKGTLED
jgi:hypothetical protein